MSIEARLSVGVRGLYPGIQIATQSFMGNDAFCRSATAETSIVHVLPSTALTYVTHDKCVKYWLLIIALRLFNSHKVVSRPRPRPSTFKTKSKTETLGIKTETKAKTLGLNTKTKTKTFKIQSRDVSRPRLKSRELQAWMLISNFCCTGYRI